MNPAPDASSGPVTDADVLVLGGTVAAMEARHTIHTAGALAIEGREILAVGPPRSCRSRSQRRAHILEYTCR